jgi:hypothetical protein
MTCHRTATAILCDADAYAVTDARGRTWRFDWHCHSGPQVTRADGEPRERQPGDRHPFWPAFEAWLVKHRKTCARCARET